MIGNISGENFPHGNSPVGPLMDGSFPGGNSPGENFSKNLIFLSFRDNIYLKMILSRLSCEIIFLSYLTYLSYHTYLISVNNALDVAIQRFTQKNDGIS